MKAKELQDQSIQALKKLAEEKRIELAKLRMELKLAKLANTSSIRIKRAELARILTVLRTKEEKKHV